jgi:ketosteroid isomerase-like protein
MNEHPNIAVIRSGYEAVGRGDMESFAALLDADIVWHESTPGFEGLYRGRDEALAMFGRVFGEAGITMTDLSVERVFADDDRAVVLLQCTMTRGDRSHTTSYVDVYRLRAGKAIEHRHLALDPEAEAKFFGS